MQNQGSSDLSKDPYQINAKPEQYLQKSYNSVRKQRYQQESMYRSQLNLPKDQKTFKNNWNFPIIPQQTQNNEQVKQKRQLKSKIAHAQSGKSLKSSQDKYNSRISHRNPVKAQSVQSDSSNDTPMNLAELDEGPSPQDVLAKMERMNPKIRIKLMKFIDNMDTFESFDTFQKIPSPRIQQYKNFTPKDSELAASNQNEANLQLSKQKTEPNPFISKPVMHKHKRPYSGRRTSEKDRESSATRTPQQNELVLKCWSTWGHASVLGITEIEVYNQNGNKIPLMPGMIGLKNIGSGGSANVSRLIDGVSNTTDNKHMWVASIPQQPKILKIVITLPSQTVIGGVKIWNYNRSLKDSIKGVKNLDVLLNGRLYWSGEVIRASGDANRDFMTDVKLIPEIKASNDELYQSSAESRPSTVQNAINSDIQQTESHPRGRSLERAKPNPINHPITKKSEQISECFFNFPERKRSSQTRQTVNEMFKGNPNLEVRSRRQNVSRAKDELGKDGVDRSYELNQRQQEFGTATFDASGPSFRQREPQIQRRFYIPELPAGQQIKLKLKSNWGDMQYIGLCGIEFFDDKGHTIRFKNYKSSIEILNQPSHHVYKILDQIYWTCDDNNSWIQPHDPENLYEIQINFDNLQRLSMIRIWNYNKSRIYSTRGVKEIEIMLDNSLIFMGEVSKAPGWMIDADQHCEYIMFTQDERILRKIQSTDWLQDYAQSCQEIERELQQTIQIPDRPSTSNKEKAQIIQENQIRLSPAKEHVTGITGRFIRIDLQESWGDPYYIGLTGINVYGPQGQIPLSINNIQATPPDMNIIPGYSGDYRTLDKLVNNKNQTCNDRNMWLIPFCPGKSHFLIIDLKQQTVITEIHFWNYNKSQEDTYRGVKKITIQLDNHLITPPSGITIRKAPGHADFNFVHIISFPYTEGWNDEQIIPLTSCNFASNIITQDYETPYLPIGYCIKFRFFSTWGDPHYLGLNGIEIFDQQGQNILQNTKFQIWAKPSQVSNTDIRTPDKLVDGINRTFDDSHMWLSPYINSNYYTNSIQGQTGKPNELSITFSKQICVSYIKFWNYSKTPTRGIKDFEVSIDDLIVYKGLMRPALQQGDWSCVVLFTGDRKLISNQISNVYSHIPYQQQNIVLYNEGRLEGGYLEEFRVISERPTTSVINN